MSDRPLVVFDSVWKKFKRGERHDSLRDLIPATIRRFMKPSKPAELQNQEFWAVNDVSFEVKRGEALGIIGPNGAGKSTALKLLTRILKPTRGHCEIRGRVGALIEVAAGFHPDLTGRENVYLQGTIMGMKHADISQRFDEIVDFSGVAPFIDTQVKRYSSGMQARLGFAIAAHLQPDVLIVDEVLSVGDISFQARCTEKMQEQMRNGVTVVFVSHNLQAVATLCSRCLVLGGGAKLYEGNPEAALDVYLRASQTLSQRHGTKQQSFSLLEARFTSEGNPVTRPMRPHQQCTLSVTLQALADTPPVNIGIEFERTRDLLYVYGATTEELGSGLVSYRRGEVVHIDATFTAHLCRGHYRLNLNVRDPMTMHFLCMAENVASFSIDEAVSYDGVVDPGLAVKTTVHSSVEALYEPADVRIGTV